MTFVVAVAALASACTNGALGLKRRTSLTNVGSGVSRPPLMVAQIVKNNSEPDRVLDLVGDGSDEMGKYCLSEGDGEGASGSSSCKCVYSWTRSDGTRESAEVESVYHENNLLRCGYSGIVPKDVSVIKIKVLLSTLGAYSNEIDFGIDGTYGASDPTNPANFMRVQRYQCRDNATVFQPTPGANGITSGLIYDPFQSDDPSFSYPLDFYTTNFGGSMAYFANLNTPNWNCPSNPDDSGFGLNFRIYSLQPAAGSTDRIINGPSRSDLTTRSNFYVSRTPTGVFKAPLNTYIAPQVLSGGTIPPIGFGAYPIRTGTGTERCPDDTVSRPPGTRWVKIWQFRATLPRRTFLFSTAVQQVGAILCNPGIPRADCGALNGGNVPNASGNMADRLLFDQQVCMQYQGSFQPCNRPGTGALSCSTNPGANALFGGYENFAYGSDVWVPYRSCGAFTPIGGDPLGFCTPTTPTAVPFEAIATPRTYTPDTTNPRSDYLLVASPPDVNSSDMVQENSRATPYIPIRYPSLTSCQVADPNPANCPGGFSYGVDLYDVSVPSNPPAGTRPSFPLCALQPVSGGSL
jgi:hypothetical protein